MSHLSTTHHDVFQGDLRQQLVNIILEYMGFGLKLFVNDSLNTLRRLGQYRRLTELSYLYQRRNLQLQCAVLEDMLQHATAETSLSSLLFGI